MRHFIRIAKNFLGDEAGATMVEYALVVALVAVAGAATAGTLATAISGQFTTAAGSI